MLAQTRGHFGPQRRDRVAPCPHWARARPSAIRIRSRTGFWRRWQGTWGIIVIADAGAGSTNLVRTLAEPRAPSADLQVDIRSSHLGLCRTPMQRTSWRESAAHSHARGATRTRPSVVQLVQARQCRLPHLLGPPPPLPAHVHRSMPLAAQHSARTGEADLAA